MKKMTNFEQKNQSYLKLLILGAILFILVFIFEKNSHYVQKNQNFSRQNLPFADPVKKNQAANPEFRFLENTFLSPNLPPFIIMPKVYAQIIEGKVLDNEILIHEVKEKETLWSIAKKYNLKIETLIWANSLVDENLKPGQELIILPTDGTLHIVKEGEKLLEIAEKYKADLENILVFNEIASPEEIFIGQALIIPGATLPKYLEPKKETKPSFSTGNFYGKSHSYPYGYCTWWVAQKRPIPSFGNAKDWLKNAQSAGYSVCFGSSCEPKIGAVVSLLTRHSLGHVAYVEDIKDGKVIFSEMNYAGLGVVTKRSLKIGDPRILGYIY